MVFVFGTICLDRVRRVPGLPAPGGYVEVTDERILLGGEAANTANALRTWGTPIRLAGNQLGGGLEGSLLRSMLEQKGLPVELLQPEPTTETEARTVSPVCDIYVTPDGDRTMFGLGFARSNPSRPIEELPLAPGDWFTADPNMGDRARHAARVAIERGTRPYLMDFLREDDPVVPGSYWQSSTDWAGVRGNQQKNVRWVREMVERRSCFVVLSDGPNGLVAGSPELPVKAYPAFPAPELVDTTGAGDMFRAGMLHGLDSGWNIADCLRFGAAAGSLKTRVFGATTYVPSAEEIRRHIAEHPEVSRAYDP